MSAARDRWMARNLATQGYCLSADRRRELWLGLRFSTGTCLALVVTGLALESAPMLFALSGIGVVGGFTARHPFDHVWNHGVSRLLDAPPLPPSPTRRRHAFKVAAAWLLVVATLFATGAGTVALALGAALVAACSVVTLANFCVPSELLAVWQRLTTGRLEVTP